MWVSACVSDRWLTCSALTVWNFAHTYEIKFRDPGWYMLAVNNSYYQPEIVRTPSWHIARA